MLDGDNVDDILEKNGSNLLFIYSDSCGICTVAENTIKDCSMTISALIDECFRIKFQNCIDFCQDNNINGTPAFVIIKDSNILSILPFNPTQDVFLTWITNTLFD